MMGCESGFRRAQPSVDDGLGEPGFGKLNPLLMVGWGEPGFGGLNPLLIASSQAEPAEACRCLPIPTHPPQAELAEAYSCGNSCHSPVCSRKLANSPLPKIK
jgi:hypothetical protein